jgi:dephospho-CoA kinase
MLVAITGNIGVGKSTLARLLEGLGARRIDADGLARQVVEEDAGLRSRLADAFGGDLLNAEGVLDRRGLARRALADEESRRQLEAIVRPQLEPLIWHQLHEAESGGAIVVFDAPLVFEWGMQDRFDAVVLVTAAPERATDRVASERGLSAGEVVQRRAAQLAEPNPGTVDFRIDNDGERAQLEAQAVALWNRLQPAQTTRGESP